MTTRNTHRTKAPSPSPLHRLPNSQLQVLLQHPQALHQQLVDIMAQGTTAPSQIIRLLALAAYLHPVMSKNVQKWMQEYTNGSLWQIDDYLDIQLEALNIVALTSQIDHRILNIQHPPNTAINCYQQALWVNALLNLTATPSAQLLQKSTSIAEPSVIQLRAMLNTLFTLKEQVRMAVYEQQTGETLLHKNSHYHELDVELSRFGLLTLSYLPEDYDTPLIEVWLDRTVELNGLLGNFVCKERFGQFQYIRGPISYAMEKGITLLLLNFGQVSSQLLVSLVALAREGTITHNQITVRATAGFRMVGVLAGQKGSKSRANIGKLVRHVDLPPKSIQLPTITNQVNNELIAKIFKDNARQLGYLGACRLWKRITNLRRKIVTINQEERLSCEEQNNRLWNSFFTQQFIDDVQLELADLLNLPAPHRLITCHQKYKQIAIGRTEVACLSPSNMKIVKTQYSLAVLEKLNICFELGEPPLLISQTGCGKTTLVQYLSQLGGHKLYVYNMSSGTDVTDLIGGFKPIDCRLLLKELFYEFCDKFRSEVPRAEKNEGYLTNLTSYYLQGRLQVLLKSLVQSIPKIMEQLGQKADKYEWKDMLRRFSSILQNLDKIDSNLVFSFLEGNLIKALKNGDWILIDQINLATNDVLQKIVPLIQGKSLMLYEKGDLHFIERHPDFRLVACMNPANDSGKKPLPPNLAQQFTSIVMSEPSVSDIEMMVRQLCPQLNASQIAELYFQIKKVKTVSLRNLSRAMVYINRNKDVYGWNRSVYDGLMLGFGSKDALKKYHSNVVPKAAANTVEISGFLLEKGNYQDKTTELFHLTDTFKQHLKDLLRAIAGTELPVLLQGPTSAGKTSMIRYVAQMVGYRCIRINNHEHTQIEQYIGNYFPDKSGKLVFREGPLVQAVREGHWLILDELNLAKTEILECLNRLLDDNRQLFIPEQQKHIKPHHNFRIFATQNPASYSGRKTLSRAFRNRFVSISFANINTDDTMAILEARSPLLRDSKELSVFVKKTLETLANYRQRQRVFQKEGLITIRNLLKWCERPFINKQKFILEGYAILGEKLRSKEQKKFVEKSLFSGCKLTQREVEEEYLSVVQRQFSEEKIAQTDIYVQMNDSFKRMAALTVKAVNNREPVLLVGQTGCGKTTLAELLAALTHRPYFSINCHKHMEASDLLGSLRPSPKATSGMQFEFINGVVIEAMLKGGILLIDQINTAEDSVLERLNQVLQSGVVGIERGQGWETVEAVEGFCIIGTMNPSGDYGKKELSPALRNRFTQIWVEPITHPQYLKAAKSDILTMIVHKLTPSFPSLLSTCIYNFLQHYNCQVAPKHNLTRKLLTMRDIGWMCKFINDSHFDTWQQRYFWSVIILAVEGVRYIMTDSIEGGHLNAMREQLMVYLQGQIEVKEEWIRQARPQYLVSLLKNMGFPLLIKTDVPIQVLGIKPHAQIFFSPQTDLSDLLGQYRPQGNDFVWHDQPLLKCVKEGGVVALVDLNMAQQQVVEGVNSLFDHRGSLFVVELNSTFYKASTFQGVVVLRKEGGNGRKGLANSFLNRFVKIYVPEVAVDLQLSYLIQNYPFLCGDLKVKEVISRLLQDKTLIIEQVQFVVQMAKNGLLSQALQILNLPTQLADNIQNSFSSIQKQTLTLFPLKRSFGLNNPSLVKLALSIFMIYKYTSFSICLVGSSRLRSSLVKALAYLINKRVAPVLISTMLDINDLLGTYQQVSTDEVMRPETTEFEDIFSKEQKGDYQSEKTKFVFVESKIVKSLKEESSLVYVEVPNQTIAERIEKGLTEIYNHNQQIVMGTDILTRKTSIAKFITIDLDELAQSFSSDDTTWQYFPSNQSKIQHLDLLLRTKETQEMIQELMNQQNDRSAVGAWRRIAGSLSTNQLEHKNREEVRQNIEQQLFSKYHLKYVQNQEVEKRTQTILGHVETASTKEELLRKVSLFSFFTGSTDHLNKYLSMLGGSEESLRQSIRKFQILFICNINHFQSNALALLPLILKSPQLSQKYFRELDRMYEQLFKHKIKQILIQFNEEEYKTVPIVSNQEAVRYLLSGESQALRRMCGEGVKVEYVCRGVEKVVVNQIGMLEVEMQGLSEWSRQAKIKHLPILSLLQKNLLKRQALLANPLEDREVISFLKELNLSIFQLPLSQQGSYLWQHFKPNPSMSVNLSYHLRNELNLKYYSQLINSDKLYLKKYSHFAALKYSGYLPSQLQLISGEIQHCEDEMVAVGKLVVYRGHDNIDSLVDFYKKMMEWTRNIEESSFHPAVIRQVITQTYQVYYHTYSDILLPFYLSLLAIHHHSYSTSADRIVPLSTLIANKPHPLALINSLIQQEEGEVDRSKDYLRFQKKFNRTVIVDEYTEEGMAKNKQNLEDEFNDLFGRDEKVRVQSPFEELYMLICKNSEQYGQYLTKTVLNHASTYEQFVSGLTLLLKYDQPAINIYQQHNPHLVNQLVTSLPAILEDIHRLLALYPIDNIKNLANLCNKIQERALYEEVYKILIDCQFLIEKIFQVNPILPMAQHINTVSIVQNCLKVRRLELRNWKKMIDFKVRRTQQSDLLEFLGLFKNIREVQNQKQIFGLCEQYLRQSKISCLPFRVALLMFLARQGVIPACYQHSLFRVIGFFDYLSPQISHLVGRARKQKEQEMRQYEKLAGWNSNQYLIFKATCEKFQRKIHHILKRYDEQLSMTVGTYHQQILERQFFNSIKQFSSGLNTMLDNKLIEPEQAKQEDEGQQQQYEVEDKEEMEVENAEPLKNEYQDLNTRIFQSLSELQQQHHNTQSKLLIIRTHLSDLQDIFHQLTLSASVQYKYLTPQMFETSEQYRRAVKYYYGLWDKLCQRSESKWYREMTDRLWHVVQKIWVKINKDIKFGKVEFADEKALDLRALVGDFIKKDQKDNHPIFNKQLDSISQYLQQIEQKQAIKPDPEVMLESNTVSLMKLGYILANISVNIQKNGLCVKEQTEENEESGSQQVGEGMGIGEGQAHDAAENVGDEIQFEEQIMGHKDEEKNEEKNANNKEENDIEMQNDFDGEVYSKQEEGQGESEGQGKSQEADEKMGEVDEKEKQKDMKNEAGEAEGSQEADVDVKNQKEGDEELIDNERQQKEERKGQQKRDMSQEDPEDRSDWDDNNEEGDKINKQKEDVEAQQQSSSFQMDLNKKPEQMQEEGSVSEGEQQEKEGDNGQSDKEDEQQEGSSEEQMENQDDNGENRNGEDIDPQAQPEQDQQKQERKPKQQQNQKKYDPSYGRRDLNTNNQVINEEENPANQMGDEGNQAHGQQQGNQGSGNPVHNLSPEFIEEVLKQHQSEGNEKFIRDLNVLIHDQKQQAAADDENAQQYELTEEKDKNATNLPIMDDQKMKQEEEQLIQEKEDKRNAEQNANREKKEQTENEKKEEKQRLSKEQKKNEQKTVNQNAMAAQKYEMEKKAQNKPKEEEKYERQKIEGDEERQKQIKNALNAIKSQPKSDSQLEKENGQDILSEAYDVSKVLEEQLKSVLEPMDNAEYRGDFKTGKKLNLKKIIPFIASNFRKDRIWLRRTEPSQRNYYIMLALDDTKSMHYGDVGTQALKGLLAISMALEHLSIKTSVCSIRDQMVTLKNFKDTLNSQRILNNFQFEYQSSNSHDLSMAAFMDSSIQSFKKVEYEDINVECRKLCFIISDGKMNKKLVAPFIKSAKKEDITYIFIIVDSQQSSIMNIKSVEYVEKKMKIKSYMADFPFEYFLIINDVKELGEILAMTLLQFIQEK